MSTYVVISVPSEDMALADTTQQLSDVTCHIEQSAMGGPDRTMTVWISCADPSNIPEALEGDSTVSEYEQLQSAGDEALYEVTLDRSLLLVRDLIHQHEGTVRAAYGGDDGWTLEVRVSSHDSLSDLNEAFDDYRIDATFEAIKPSADLAEEQRNDLTEGQRELLEAAIELGYFDIPRSATLEDIGDELDVTHQALSERLRRAQQKLAAQRVRTQDQQPESQGQGT